MGSVYRAWDSNLQTDVVVKMPHATAHDSESTARFAREASSLVRLSQPHIVKIVDFGEQGGQPFAVMQFLSGGSLATRHDNSGGRCQSSDSLTDWLPDIAKALDFVHSQGYLHRDVKPANILFDAYGNAFLSDFGITKFAVAAHAANSGKSLTGAGMVLGTPEYMAPEVILGQPADGRLDQYGLAVTVFEFLAGRRPFEDPTPTAVLVQQTTSPPPDIRSFNADLAPSLSTVLYQALAKNPAERFPSCTAFADAVQAALSGKSQTAKLKCPVCHKSLKLDWKVRGRTVSCPACGAELRVADDLSGLTLSTGGGGSQESRGGTRAVMAGDAVRGQRGDSVPQQATDQAPIHSENFWELDRISGSDPTTPITAGEIRTGQSRVIATSQSISDPDTPMRAKRARTRILVGSGTLVVLIVLATGTYLGSKVGNETKKEDSNSRSAEAALSTEQKKAAARIVPGVAVAKDDGNPKQDDLHPTAANSKPAPVAPAVYNVSFDPPDAQLSVDGASVSRSGFGFARVVVQNPKPHVSVALVASAKGYKEQRRNLTPRPGIEEVMLLKLEPIQHNVLEKKGGHETLSDISEHSGSPSVPARIERPLDQPAQPDEVRTQGPDANEVIEKAIRALGGEKILTKLEHRVIGQRLEGTMYVDGRTVTFSQQTFTQGFDHWREEFEGDAGRIPVKYVRVLSGERGWQKVGNMISKIEGEQLAGFKRGTYLAVVAAIIVPLRGKDFKVESTKEDTLDGKPAVLLKIIGPDKKTFELFFDRQNGLPVKLVINQNFTGKETKIEQTFSRYKRFSGIRWATEARLYKDGELVTDAKIVDVEFLAKVSPMTFAQPVIQRGGSGY